MGKYSRVHLVTLTRVDGLLLNRLNLQRFELLIKDLTQIHDYTFMDLLPQVSTEDLDQTDLQGRDLTVPVSTCSLGVPTQVKEARRT